MSRASQIDLALGDFFEPLLEARSGSGRGEPGNVVVIAFSGGPDSTALLLGLRRATPRLGLELHAFHLDHGLDPDSPRRAKAALRLAERAGVPCRSERLQMKPRPGESPEAAARRARYAALECFADELGASFIATAHHADDQAETVLLRLLFGSGLEGLAAIRPRHGRWVRPLLGLRREVLAAGLRELAPGVETVDDPTNRDLAIPRNRLRHRLLPRLEERDSNTVERLGRLAAAAGKARRVLERRLERRLSPRPLPDEPGVEVRRDAFEELPEALWPYALALLHRRAGIPYPAPAAAREELVRQLRAGRSNGERVGCDCGAGWRWEAASGRLQLLRREYSSIDFSYTLGIPGVVSIPEIGSRFHLRRGKIASWMFSLQPDRAGMALAAGENATVEIRNRRPGDRIVPLGSHRRRRLKNFLIGRYVPRRQRDRLPLLVIDGEIAWVPGIILSERHRLQADPRAATASEVWIARIESL